MNEVMSSLLVELSMTLDTYNGIIQFPASFFGKKKNMGRFSFIVIFPLLVNISQSSSLLYSPHCVKWLSLLMLLKWGAHWSWSWSWQAEGVCGKQTVGCYWDVIAFAADHIMATHKKSYSQKLAIWSLIPEWLKKATPQLLNINMGIR